MKVVEDAEECVLSTRFASKLLNIIENKYIYTLIEVDEVWNILLYCCGLILRLKLAHRNIEHLQLGVTHTNLVTYSLSNMGFTQSGVTIYI